MLKNDAFWEKKIYLKVVIIRHLAKRFGVGGFSPEQDEVKAIVS